MGKPWKTHLKDLPNAAAFAAKAAGQNQGCRKMEEIKQATLRKKRLCRDDECIGYKDRVALKSASWRPKRGFSKMSWLERKIMQGNLVR